MSVTEKINKDKNLTLGSKLVWGLTLHAENMFYSKDEGRHKDFEHNNDRLQQMNLQ